MSAYILLPLHVHGNSVLECVHCCHLRRKISHCMNIAKCIEPMVEEKSRVCMYCGLGRGEAGWKCYAIE